MKASTALYIGGYVWTAKSLVLVPGALAESQRPSLVLAAMVVLVIAPGVAARRLLVTDAPDYRFEPLAFAAVPMSPRESPRSGRSAVGSRPNRAQMVSRI